MLKTKDEKLVTSGEFAKLSQSTKRTVHWYTKQGLLRPKRINSAGYRLYALEQIIDFQVMMLLRKLNFSLPEIKKFMRKNASTRALFLQKKQTMEAEIAKLQRSLDTISTFYTNLETEGVLVKPGVVTVPSFKMYYLEKIGPYSKILEYCYELKADFSSIPKNATFLVLFPDREYAPKKDRMKIGVIATGDMKIKPAARELVKTEVVPSFKSLQYQHLGSPALISMIIMQMHEYMEKKQLKQDLSIPINELELYKLSALNDRTDSDTMLSEINIPIV